MRAAILLAAGSSRRFGQGDKLMAMLGGTPLLRHALDRALGSGARRVIVVTPAGGRIARLVRALDHPRVAHVRAARHREGLAASLAAGLAAVRPIERELLIFLADMPFARMPRALRLSPGHGAARPIVGGRPGHPLLVRTHAARAASRAAGDTGLAARLGRIGTSRGAIGNLVDIDTPAALRRARIRIARAGVGPRLG